MVEYTAQAVCISTLACYFGLMPFRVGGIVIPQHAGMPQSWIIPSILACALVSLARQHHTIIFISFVFNHFINRAHRTAFMVLFSS